jgi:hypothetical protein
MIKYKKKRAEKMMRWLENAQRKKWWTVVMTYKSGGGKSENSIEVNNNALVVEGS